MKNELGYLSKKMKNELGIETFCMSSLSF
jgi:hypothetical protein